MLQGFKVETAWESSEKQECEAGDGCSIKAKRRWRIDEAVIV